MHTENITLA